MKINKKQNIRKRICYDYYFMPSNSNGDFKFSGEFIEGVSLCVKFRIFINSEEIFYKDNEKEIFSYGSRKFYPTNFIKCYYNPKTGWHEFKKNSDLFQLAKLNGLDIRFEYIEYDFYKDLKNESYPINITRDEFCKILNNKEFDNSDNKPAQNLAYCLVDVND